MPPLPAKALSKLASGDKFAVDVTAGKVALSTNGQSVDIGDQLVYTDARVELN